MSIPTPGSILFCIAAVTLGFVMVTATGCQREADVAKAARTKGGKTAPSHKGTEKSAKKAFVFLSPKERRAAFERCKTLSAKSLGVREPIEVVESDIYADGGTITLKFRDATKHEFAAKLPTQWNYKPGEKVPYFFGPGEKSLKKLPFGGREERALCGLMVRWAKNQPPFWLLLSADRQSWMTWYGFVHSSEYREPFGDKLYYRNRALLFTFSLLIRSAKQTARRNGS
ncbi:MAG: hypothetical protein ACE5KM_11325 [Planctomycetaceae bacterium]